MKNTYPMLSEQRRDSNLASRATSISLLLFVVSTLQLSAQSLDDQLFEDLAEPAARKTQSADDVAAEQFQQELQRELGGEDVGQRPESPLGRTAEIMRRVQDRLSVKDTAARTREMQQGIVADFDKLIASLKKQQQKKKKSGGSQQKQGKAQQPSQPKPKPQQQGKPGGAKQSNQAAKESRTKLGQASSADTTPRTRDQVMQDSWGNLPAGTRQQMQSARPEKFLPKYERLIEEYFRRLAEDNE